MAEVTQPLETAWVRLLSDAGWTDSLYGTANGSARATYEANVDRLAAEREDELRALIAVCRVGAGGFAVNYIDGIEAALDRAIAEPRQA